MQLPEMVNQLRREMASVSDGHTYHYCECSRANQCRSVKCWQCWADDLKKAVGKTHADWLVRKVRELMSIETDIRHFVKSQEEKEGGK